jgi:hypothetical protein
MFLSYVFIREKALNEQKSRGIKSNRLRKERILHFLENLCTR